MIATKARRAECSGRFVAQRQIEGRWVDEWAEPYIGEQRRAFLLKDYSEWAHGSTAEVRRVVEHFTEHGRQRHVIRAESGPKAEPEPWSEVDCDLGLYHRQGVDYSAPDLQ